MSQIFVQLRLLITYRFANKRNYMRRLKLLRIILEVDDLAVAVLKTGRLRPLADPMDSK